MTGVDREAPRRPDTFRLRRRDIALVVTLGLAQAAGLVAFLLLVREIVNNLSATEAFGAAGAVQTLDLRLLAGLAAAGVAVGLLRAWEFSAAEKAGYEVVRRVRMQMYAHLQGMSPRQLQHRARGGLLLRFTGDLSMMRMWLSRGKLGGIVALIVLAGTTAVLAVLNVWMAVTLVGVLAAGAALSLASGHRVRRATRIMRRRRSLVMGNVDEQLNALPVVQVFGRSPGEYSRFSRQNDAMNKALNAVASLRGLLRGISASVGLLAAAAVLAVGLLEVSSGRATLGLVLGAVIVVRYLDTPVRTLGLAHDYWQRGLVSRRKIADFLASSTTQLDDPGQGSLRVRKGAVEFRDVTVPGALSGIRATAPAGSVIAVTGRSGAGKSTLLGLVARLVEPSEGSVLIDDQELSGVTPKSTYRHLGMVSPDLPLMRGTVRRNLTYRMPGATEDEVQRIVLATGLDEVLDQLPDGLASWVTEGGRNLSTGQRQRIALGRALLGNPPLLLLDEPTAGLDPASKAAVLDAVAHYAGTVLLATHDPAELMLADTVWVLEEGRLVRTAPAEEYRESLWNAPSGRSLWAAALPQ